VLVLDQWKHRFSRFRPVIYLQELEKEGSLIISHLTSAFKLALQWQQHAGLWNPLQKPRKDDCVIPMIYQTPQNPERSATKKGKKKGSKLVPTRT